MRENTYLQQIGEMFHKSVPMLARQLLHYLNACINLKAILCIRMISYKNEKVCFTYRGQNIKVAIRHCCLPWGSS